MQNYKAPDNSVHFLEDSAFEYLLPPGSIQITNAQADSMQPPPYTPTALDQIRALEQTHIDDQRKLNRQAAIDTALTVACRSPAAEGKTRDEVHAIYYATNRGYRAMVDLEAQIAELRKQL